MLPKRVLIRLNRSELEALSNFIKQCSAQMKWRPRQRAQAVLFAHQGKTVLEITVDLKCSTRAVYLWIRRFKKKGIEGLVRSRRPVKLNSQQINQIMEVSHWSTATDKRKVREFRIRWSFRKMAQWVRDAWGIKLSHECVRQIVQRKLKEFYKKSQKKRN